MKTPQEIMLKFKFFPDVKDEEACINAYASFIGWSQSTGLELADASLFKAAFNRGAYWLQEKHKEKLDLMDQLLGTNDIELAKKRAKILLKLAKRGKKL